MAEQDARSGVRLAKRRTEAEWRRMVRAWKESGAISSVFAVAQGVLPITLRWWSSELKRRDRRAAAAPTALRFVELKPRPAPVAVSVSVPVPQGPRGLGVEVVLSSRRVIRVAPGFDAVTLQQVVVSLEACPC